MRTTAEALPPMRKCSTATDPPSAIERALGYVPSYISSTTSGSGSSSNSSKDGDESKEAAPHLRAAVELRRAKSFGSCIELEDDEDDDEVLWQWGESHGASTKRGIDAGDRDAPATTSLGSFLCLDGLDEWARAVQDAALSWRLSAEEIDRVEAALAKAEVEVKCLYR